MRLGKYEIEGELGRGGMGIVYRARGPDGRPVAVKVLGVSPGGVSATSLLRFRREAELLIRLRESRGFVSLLDAGDSDRGPFFVMPLLAGGTLGDRLERERILPIGDVVRIVARVARSLAAAHAQGIVHRDLKPENILFTAEGEPQIADLGLAKHFHPSLSTDDDGSCGLSRTGEFKGTLGYVAPEQMRDAKAVSSPADVYSLGVILFECLSGELPHDAENPVELFIQVQNRPADPLHTRRPDVPRWLSDLVARALSFEAAERFPDAAALADALEAAGAGRPGGGASEARTAVIAVAAAVAAALVVAAVFIVVRGEPTGTTAEVGRSAPDASDVPDAPDDGDRGGDSGEDDERPSPAPTGRTFEAAAADLAAYRRASATGALSVEQVIGRPSGWHHVGFVREVGFSADGRLAFSTGLDGLARLWSVATGAPVGSFAGAGSTVGGADLTSNAARIVLGGNDGAIVSPRGGWVRCYDVASGELLGERQLGFAIVYDVEVLPGDELALVCARGELLVLELPELQERTRIAWDGVDAALVPGDDGRARALVLGDDSDGGTRKATTGLLALFDLETGEELARGEVPVGGDVRQLAVTPDGRSALITPGFGGPEANRAILVELPSLRRLAALGPHGDWVRSVGFIPGAGLAVTGASDGLVRLFELETGDLVGTLVPRAGQIRAWITAVAASPDGSLVATSDQGGTVRLYEVATRGEVWPSSAVTVLAATPAAEDAPADYRILAGGDGGRIRVLRPDGTELRELESSGAPLVLVTTEDGRFAVSGTAPGIVERWEIDTGEVRRVTTHASGAGAVAASPDGDWVGSVDLAGRLRMTRVSTGEERSVVLTDGEGRGIRTLAVGLLGIPGSPGDWRFVLAGENGLGRFWHRDSGLDESRGIGAPEIDRVRPVPLAFASSAGAADLVFGGHLRHVWRYRPDTGEVADVGSAPRPIRMLDVSNDGRRVIGSEEWGLTAAVWDLSTIPTTVLDELDLGVASDRCRSVAAAPDGSEFLIGTQRGVIVRLRLR